MITIALWVAAVIGAIIILSIIPGMSTILRPIIEGFIRGVGVVLAGAAAYVIWIAKEIFFSHFEIVRHLLHSEDYFDPEKQAKQTPNGE